LDAGSSDDFGGLIQDGTNPLSLTVMGSGMQSLSGVNTYSGGTNLNGGTLAFTSGALGTGPISFGGGTLLYADPPAAAQDISASIANCTGPIQIDTNGNTVALSKTARASDASLIC
jgi:autotransporter-associated beta strand protein